MGNLETTIHELVQDYQRQQQAAGRSSVNVLAVTTTGVVAIPSDLLQLFGEPVQDRVGGWSVQEMIRKCQYTGCKNVATLGKDHCNDSHKSMASRERQEPTLKRLRTESGLGNKR